MTRVRRPRALAELFLPWTIAALMLTLAWFTFQLQPAVSPPVAVRQAPQPVGLTAHGFTQGGVGGPHLNQALDAAVAQPLRGHRPDPPQRVDR